MMKAVPRWVDKLDDPRGAIRFHVAIASMPYKGVT
jgi:hypothetical protein